MSAIIATCHFEACRKCVNAGTGNVCTIDDQEINDGMVYQYGEIECGCFQALENPSASAQSSVENVPTIGNGGAE